MRATRQAFVTRTPHRQGGARAHAHETRSERGNANSPPVRNGYRINAREPRQAKYFSVFLPPCDLQKSRVERRTFELELLAFGPPKAVRARLSIRSRRANRRRRRRDPQSAKTASSAAPSPTRFHKYSIIIIPLSAAPLAPCRKGHSGGGGGGGVGSMRGRRYNTISRAALLLAFTYENNL